MGSELPQPTGALESCDGVKLQEDDEEFTFRPAHFFFYGSLMDQDILSRVVRLRTSEYPPEMKEASVRGFKMKMWNGEYPVLIPACDRPGQLGRLSGDGRVALLTNSVRNAKKCPSSDVHISGADMLEHDSEVITGRLWLATDFEQALRLQKFETAAYEACDCLVRLEDGSGKLVRAVTFRWAGNPNDPILHPGRFNLEEYQRTVKPKLLGFE